MFLILQRWDYLESTASVYMLYYNRLLPHSDVVYFVYVPFFKNTYFIGLCGHVTRHHFFVFFF